MRELERITRGRDAGGWLFLNHKGRRLASKIFDKPNQRKNPHKLPPPCRAWYRLQALAGVRPRSIHNLRRAAVSVLARANVTMEKIVEVTGQTPDVVRECYLQLGSETQLQTMGILGAIYGIAREEEAEEEDRGTEEDLPASSRSPVRVRLSRPEARLFAGHLGRLISYPKSNFGKKSDTKWKF